MESGLLHRRLAGQHAPSNDPALMEKLNDPVYSQRGKYLAEEHAIHLASFTGLAAPRNGGIRTGHRVGAAINSSVSADTVFVIEAVPCDVHISDQLQTSILGSWIDRSGLGLGRSGGATLAIRLALENREILYLFVLLLAMGLS